MTIEDVVVMTGGNTKVKILGIDKNDHYFMLWSGTIDDIDFTHIPYGDHSVEHITVINGEDILQLHCLIDKEN